MAVTENQDVNELNDDDFFGFPVDVGLGCFCDAQTQDLASRFFTEFYQKNTDQNIYDDFFAAQFKENAIDKGDPNDIGDWLNFIVPGSPGLNVIMFHSGYGDGAYPCYWGITDKGNVSSLIVDFQVFEES